MKAVELSKFRPNKRSIGRDMWGTVNSSTPTSQKRASWIDCAGHGGYVCDPKDFTEEELSIMGEPNYKLNIGIGVDSLGKEYVVAVDYPYGKSRNHRISVRYQFVEWRIYPMYVFEEDCNWAILTFAAGVYLQEHINKGLKSDVYSHAIDTLKHCNPSVLERSLRVAG